MEEEAGMEAARYYIPFLLSFLLLYISLSPLPLLILIITTTFNKKQLYDSLMLNPSPPHMNWNPRQNLCPSKTCEFEEIFP